MYAVQVPDGLTEGDQFQANVAGQLSSISVPAGVQGGQTIHVQGPQPAPVPVVAVPAGKPRAATIAPAPIPVVQGVAVSAEMASEAFAKAPQDNVKLIDATTAGILATVNDFEIHQRVKFWEVLTQGWIEQSNTYDVFDATTGAHLFIVQEHSDDCERCFCAPAHSLHASFKLVNGINRTWSTTVDIHGMPTAFTADRVGCCTRPCLGCFICSDACKDGVYVHAGNSPTPPGTSIGPVETTIGYATQPDCGGCFTPTINLYHRVSQGGGFESFAPMAKVEGPTLFGGCSELCCDSTFHVSRMDAGNEQRKLKLGDLATITKRKPRGCGSIAREMFTDSDVFTMKFKEGISLTPQQKATAMASLILADYMFFEKDQGMCSIDGQTIRITLCDMYCCGCTQPLNVVVPINNRS